MVLVGRPTVNHNELFHLIRTCVVQRPYTFGSKASVCVLQQEESCECRSIVVVRENSTTVQIRDAMRTDGAR